MSRSTSFTWTLLWALLVSTLRTGTCQLHVQGFTGGEVLLPCVYTGSESLDVLSVFWRDKDDRHVLNIIRNKPDFQTQNHKFRGRVSIDPELHRKGNFSIVMQNLVQSDSGPYECHVLPDDFLQRVTLAVSGKRVEATAAATRPPGATGSASVTRPLMALLAPALFLISDV